MIFSRFEGLLFDRLSFQLIYLVLISTFDLELPCCHLIPAVLTYTYHMAAATSPREVGESVTRITKEGRKLTYTLTVIQQPERARACGSGAKCKSG